MTDVTPMPQLLAEACEDAACWRREKAREYPADARNRQWAANLDAMAKWAATLPHDDERLLQLYHLRHVEASDLLRFGQQASRTLSQCHASDREGFDSLLSALVTDAETDAREMAHSAGVWLEWEPR